MPQYGIFAVADGVGGALSGDVASQMVVEMLGEAFANFSGEVSPEEMITVAIDRANLAINQMASEMPQMAAMATTVVVLHLTGSTATIAHVGDSRLYRLTPDGTLYRETADHSVVEEAVRAGQMTPEQAAMHPSRNVISRAVGAEMSVDIDIKKIDVQPGTIFLLCSDGITRHIGDQELESLLTTGMSLEMLCEQMKEMCYDRGAEDNLTAVLVKVPGSPVRADSATDIHSGSIATEGLYLDEEETIATARSPFDNVAERFGETPNVSADILEGSGEIAASPNYGSIVDEIEQPPIAITKDIPSDDESYLMDIPQPEPVFDPEDQPELEKIEHETVSSDYASSRVIVPAGSQATTSETEKEFSIFGQTSSTVVKQNVAPSKFGSFLRSLIYLLLGAALGAAGLYFWQQSNPEPQPVSIPVSELTPRTNNVPASSFEELRWRVDQDPNAYIKSNVAATKDAEDHYILGRALFLTGEHFAARRQFILALSKISEAEPGVAATIRADIAMMNSIMGDPQAAEAFKSSFAEVMKQNSNTAPASNTVDAANSSNLGNMNASP
ncbi:protein phosphatase 2C domain-containing protein [Leptolyngbya sp. 7M]|nr:protein phosphatase 2C domain-containing protein [Leptolyngbya sp. 7M]